MAKFIFSISALLILTAYCTGRAQTIQFSSKNSLVDTSFKITTIDCDSIYPNKNYKITFVAFDPVDNNNDNPNNHFTLSRLSRGAYTPILSDSIFSKTRIVEFADFNNDNVPDILVQHISDVRSNWTYYLYLVDTVQNRAIRIKGFEEIKNPVYLPKYGLISNYVMSGKIWTSFYKIKGGSVKDFGIVIYDNQTDDGSYDSSYKKAIRAILKKERSSR